MEIENTKENTPQHCHDCWKFEECRQAQNMTVDTEAVHGFAESEKYVDCFCADCLPEDAPEQSTSPLDYDEVDTPCHCSVCGIPLIHSLTNEGVKYVQAAIKTGDGCCRELWPVIWADYLPAEDDEDEEDERPLPVDELEQIIADNKDGRRPRPSLIGRILDDLLWTRRERDANKAIMSIPEDDVMVEFGPPLVLTVDALTGKRIDFYYAMVTGTGSVYLMRKNWYDGPLDIKKFAEYCRGQAIVNINELPAKQIQKALAALKDKGVECKI